MLAGHHVGDRFEAPQGGEPGDRHCSGLFEGERRWLERQFVFAGGSELGEGALCHAEHLIARLEAGAGSADSRYDS